MDVRSTALMAVVVAPFLYQQYRVLDLAYDTHSVMYVWHWHSAPRLTIPFYTGILQFLSTVIYGAYALAVPGTNPYVTTAADLLRLSIGSAAIAGLLIAKGYFGPAVAGYVVATTMTGYFAHGTLEVPKLFDLLVGSLLGPGWDSLSVVYTVFVTGNGILSPFIRFRNAVDFVGQVSGPTIPGT
ncbi:MAG: hypothetical protein JO040_10545 [Gemmatimonadetes bacterium]|nr:hypothetical protein [Gemmatimonadota bacterium]